ncbi:hypothetical protein EMCRGX_G034616 [Ephydatia muelleri]|eukprot:Em0023g520a
MVTIFTAPYHGYQVLFSPFERNKIAFTGAVNYGISGNGALLIYERDEVGYKEFRRYPWKDGLFDVTWSELNEAVLVTASGDGSVVIYDQAQPHGPVTVFTGHTAEVSSVHWSTTRQEQLVISASWDGTVRLWDPNAQVCVAMFTEHAGLVYTAVWSPHIPHTFASVSGDGTIRLWDSSAPPNSTASVNANCGEVLSCDWSKYNEYLLFTGGVDCAVKLWDIRQLGAPLHLLMGHGQAVRRVRASPHDPNIIASCSYDFTVRLWNIGTGQLGGGLLDIIAHHTEFTYGLDFSLHDPGMIADCSWDQTIKLLTPVSIAPKPAV